MAKSKQNNYVALAVIGSIIMAAIFIGLFVWYIQTVAPHTYPTRYTNLFWGFTHGIFIVPTFFWSLFADTVTIYQAPNDGNWYNLGYFIGISIIFGGTHGAKKVPNKSKSKKND